MHQYERLDSTCSVCRRCGTAKHRNGWFWFANRRSRVEPKCDIVIDDEERDDWMANALSPPPNC